MDQLLEANGDLRIVDSSFGIELLQEDGKETNPHIWLSLRNAAIQVENICSGLSDLDPDSMDYYIQNRDDYLKKLHALDEQFNRSNVSTPVFIVHHPAWSYFARDYSLEQIPLLEEEKEPGPGYLSQVIDLARERISPQSSSEPQFNPKAAEVIAREMSARLISLDPQWRTIWRT